MNRRKPFAGIIPWCTAAALSLGACFGQSRGGSDGETHFLCRVEADCAAHGRGLRCVEGVCRDSSGSLGGGTALTNGLDAGSGGTASGDATVTASGSRPGAAGATGSKAGAGHDSSSGSTPGSVGDAGPPGAGAALEQPITLSGTVTLAPGFSVPPGDLRVGLFWFTGYFEAFVKPFSDPQCAGAAQAYGLVPQPATTGQIAAPGRFSLTIDAEPPPVAFISSPLSFQQGMRLTQGAILVYVDGNGNGRLDFATPSSTSPDRVLGTSAPWDTTQTLGIWPDAESYRITFSTEAISNVSPPYPAGYGIAHWVTDSAENPSDGDNPPLDSAIQVELGARLRATTLVCRDVCFEHQTPLSCPSRISDLPAGGEWTCFPATDQTEPSLSWRRRTCDGCRCSSGDECVYTSVPEPEGWPCSMGDAGP